MTAERPPGRATSGRAGGIMKITWRSGAVGGVVMALRFAQPPIASPTNPIGAYLPATQTLDGTSVTGFYVYKAFLGTATLVSSANEASGPQLTLNGASLPEGSYIVAFLEESTSRRAICDPST